MYFKQIRVEGLGCLSYVVGCPAAKQMAVIDPKRDVGDYLDIARDEGMKITHVIDTHVHADHVSGGQELRSYTGADIYLYEGSPVEYDFKPLKEGDRLDIGNAGLEVLHTPGHTPQSMSLLLTDKARSEEPWMLLTGDLLFVGDIGRPDLVGQAVLDEQVNNLYQSLYVKLAALPEYLEVFPAHGMGSLCGRSMSAKPSTTLGYERRFNPMLQFPSYDDFHVEMTREFPARPKSFSHIIGTNVKGALLLDRCPLDRALAPDRFEEIINQGAVVLDTRNMAAFGGFHIPNSINIGFEKQLANWVGMVVDPKAELLLVTDDREDYEAMRLELHRIGYDNILGYLSGGIDAWMFAGKPLDKLAQVSVHELKNRLGNPPDFILLDVRTDGEWKTGHIEGARHIQLSDLLDRAHDLPVDREIIVSCGSGYRSNIVASYLQQHGYDQVYSLAGGAYAWHGAGYPLTV